MYPYSPLSTHMIAMYKGNIAMVIVGNEDRCKIEFYPQFY